MCTSCLCVQLWFPTSVDYGISLKLWCHNQGAEQGHQQKGWLEPEPERSRCVAVARIRFRYPELNFMRSFGNAGVHSIQFVLHEGMRVTGQLWHLFGYLFGYFLIFRCFMVFPVATSRDTPNGHFKRKPDHLPTHDTQMLKIWCVKSLLPRWSWYRGQVGASEVELMCPVQALTCSRFWVVWNRIN